MGENTEEDLDETTSKKPPTLIIVAILASVGTILATVFITILIIRPMIQKGFVKNHPIPTNMIYVKDGKTNYLTNQPKYDFNKEAFAQQIMLNKMIFTNFKLNQIRLEDGGRISQ
jgi:hypothetical protein